MKGLIDCHTCVSCSGQWGDSGVSQSGWDPKTSTSLPQRRTFAAVPLLPGERAAPSRTAGPSSLVPEGKGQDIVFPKHNTNTYTWDSYRRHEYKAKLRLFDLKKINKMGFEFRNGPIVSKR